MAETAIRSRLTLRDIYGDLVYCPRASPRSNRWLSADAVLLNSRTGNTLAVVGDMDVMCARGASRRESFDLLRTAGLDLPSRLHAFSSEDEYYEVLGTLARGEKKLVAVHAHGDGEIPDARLWCPRSLVVQLNNKAHLGELVPVEYTPSRRVCERSGLAGALAAAPLPVVLKAATDVCTGGGGDVRLCRTREDVAAARDAFAECSRIVVVELLDLRRSVCLNYAVLADGSVTYLGGAEQICSEAGLYLGNWVDRESAVPASVIGMGASVAASGAKRGYRGIVGVDVAILADGRAVAFDLNFRTNGSTGMLLLYDAIVRSTGKDVVRLRGWRGLRTYEDLIDAGYIALDSGYFLPLMAYDPETDGFASASPRLSGLMLGSSRAEVHAHEREMSALGLE